MAAIISEQNESEKNDNNRQKERSYMEALCNTLPIEKAKIEELNFSILFNPEDLKNVIHTHNQLLRNIESFESLQITQKKEIEDLKTTLNKELQKEQPNIKEITDKIVKQ